MFSNRLVAHRGYPRMRPENTLPSIVAALEAGARFIEVDVQLSKDGQPVLFHDRDLQRLCKKDGSIHDYAWAGLQTLPVYFQEQTNSDWRIAHLDDFVSLLNRWPGVRAFVELKRNSLQQFSLETMVGRVLQTIKTMKTEPVLISYSLPALDYVRQVCSLPIGAIMDDWTALGDEQVVALHAEYLFCDIESLPDTGSLKPAKGKLVVFECTDPVQALDVLQRGVDLVETFAIGEMLSQLQARHV